MKLNQLVFLCILFFFSLLIYSCGKPKTHTHKRKDLRSLTAKQDHSKLHVKRTKNWSVLDLFRNEQKRRALRCPDKSKDRENITGKFKETDEENDEETASIKRHTRSIHFDIIELDEAKLEIPAFKQFRNNMTDFTNDGEEQFKFILNEIRDFLGENTDGEGITLKIIGSASQIPTSFDPSKPNNNINEDGSSKAGLTSIENNRKLAQARAMELARKIKEVFTNIIIDTPELEEIQLGPTIWDKNAQDRLNDAFLRGDKAGMEAVYEPFQKEQYVLVESQDYYMKTVKPESIEMYLVSIRPKIIYTIDNGEEKTISSFIVSKNTYEKIGGTLQFDSVEERDAYLKHEHLKKIDDRRQGDERWFLYANHEELNAIQLVNDYQRIYSMYELGIVDEKDKEVLKEIIREKYLSPYKK